MSEKIINLDESLKGIDESEFDYPLVSDTPKGWPSLKNIDGRTWYQRALNYEAWQGQRVLPEKYLYDENRKIILNPDYKEEDDGTE